MITIYGLKNCDSCRKARKWFEAQNLDHKFHDFRQDGLVRDKLEDWLEHLGTDKIINRRGTTWRKLEDMQKDISTKAQAADLIMAHPALIKRPVIEANGNVTIGFGDEVKQALTS